MAAKLLNSWSLGSKIALSGVRFQNTLWKQAPDVFIYVICLEREASKYLKNEIQTFPICSGKWKVGD